ncbi:hypothetical protein WJX72_010477 [[Myrmecia] bisecta]|uniref:BRX domain-containing protein n=1 Tax=[Myrmecia] bisecta TaxID=41462 RepID=A0AAW1PXS5_9CHLO
MPEKGKRCRFPPLWISAATGRWAPARLHSLRQPACGAMGWLCCGSGHTLDSDHPATGLAGPKHKDSSVRAGGSHRAQPVQECYRSGSSQQHKRGQEPCPPPKQRLLAPGVSGPVGSEKVSLQYSLRSDTHLNAVDEGAAIKYVQSSLASLAQRAKAAAPRRNGSKSRSRLMTDTSYHTKEVERGVMLTWKTRFSGQGQLTRILFDRARFSKPEAARWWRKNKNELAAKYNLQLAPHADMPSPSKQAQHDQSKEAAAALLARLEKGVAEAQLAAQTLPVPAGSITQLLSRAFCLAREAAYFQPNCQALLLRACEVQKLAFKQQESSRTAIGLHRLHEVLGELVDFCAQYSRPGWLLRLESSLDDTAQFECYNDMLLDCIDDVEDRERLESRPLVWVDDSEWLRNKVLEVEEPPKVLRSAYTFARLKLLNQSADDTAFHRMVEAEVQEFYVLEVKGAHQIIRHKAMRLLWWVALKREEVPWEAFWSAIQAALPILPDTLAEPASLDEFRRLIGQADVRRPFEKAVHTNGDPGCVTAADIDVAFPPGACLVTSLRRLAGTAVEPTAEFVEARMLANGFWETSLGGTKSHRWLVAHIIDELTSPDAEVCSNAVMLVGDQSSAAATVAAAIAKDMLISGRWRGAIHADLQGVRSAEEAASRLLAALGVKSYPVQTEEVTRLTTWLQERCFAPGELGIVVDMRDVDMQPAHHHAIASLLSKVLRAAPHLHLILCSPEPFEIAGESEMPYHTVIAMSSDEALGFLKAITGTPKLGPNARVLAAACGKAPWLIQMMAASIRTGSLDPARVLALTHGMLPGPRPTRPIDSCTYEYREAMTPIYQNLQLQTLLSILAGLDAEQRDAALRLAVVPGAFCVETAARILPSLYEAPHVQALLRRLTTRHLLQHNAAQQTYRVVPALRPLLLEAAQQGRRAVFAPALMAFVEHCLRLLEFAASLKEGNAELCSLRVVDRERLVFDQLVSMAGPHLPAQTAPLYTEVLSNHMDQLTQRLSVRQQEALCSACARTAEAMGDVLGEAHCLLQLGRVGQFKEADAALGRSVQLVEQALRPDHPLVATILVERARIHTLAAKLDEAEKLLYPALYIQERAEGMDSLPVAATLLQLAGVLQRLGAYTEAMSMYQRCLSIRKRHLHSQHPDVAVALARLGQCQEQMGRLEASEGKYQEALGIWEGGLARAHPEFATLLGWMAALQTRAGIDSEAEQLYRRSLDMWQNMAVSDHPEQLASLRALSNLLTAQGRAQEVGKLRRTYSGPAAKAGLPAQVACKPQPRRLHDGREEAMHTPRASGAIVSLPFPRKSSVSSCASASSSTASRLQSERFSVKDLLMTYERPPAYNEAADGRIPLADVDFDAFSDVPEEDLTATAELDLLEAELQHSPWLAACLDDGQHAQQEQHVPLFEGLAASLQAQTQHQQGGGAAQAATIGRSTSSLSFASEGALTAGTGRPFYSHPEPQQCPNEALTAEEPQQALPPSNVTAILVLDPNFYLCWEEVPIDTYTNSTLLAWVHGLRDPLTAYPSVPEGQPLLIDHTHGPRPELPAHILTYDQLVAHAWAQGHVTVPLPSMLITAFQMTLAGPAQLGGHSAPSPLRPDQVRVTAVQNFWNAAEVAAAHGFAMVAGAHVYVGAADQDSYRLMPLPEAVFILPRVVPQIRMGGIAPVTAKYADQYAWDLATVVDMVGRFLNVTGAISVPTLEEWSILPDKVKLHSMYEEYYQGDSDHRTPPIPTVEDSELRKVMVMDERDPSIGHYIVKRQFSEGAVHVVSIAFPAEALQEEPITSGDSSSQQTAASPWRLRKPLLPLQPEDPAAGLEELAGPFVTRPMYLLEAAELMGREGCGEGWLLQPKIADMGDLEYRVYLVGGADAQGSSSDTVIVYTPSVLDDRGIYMTNMTLPIGHFWSDALEAPDGSNEAGLTDMAERLHRNRVPWECPELYDMIVKAARDGAQAMARSARFGAALPTVRHVFARVDVVMAAYYVGDEMFVVPVINEMDWLNSAGTMLPAWKTAFPVVATGLETTAAQAGMEGTFGYGLARSLAKQIVEFHTQKPSLAARHDL